MCKNKCAVCAMYSVHIAYIAHRAYISKTSGKVLYMNVARYAFLFTLAGPTHFARISKITTRQIFLHTFCVNVVNSDNVGTDYHCRTFYTCIYSYLIIRLQRFKTLYRLFEKSAVYSLYI